MSGPIHLGPTKSETEIKAEQDLILQSLECVLAGSKAIYVSGPITTGLRYLDWFKRSEHGTGSLDEHHLASLRSAVIEPNEKDIVEFARQLRTKSKQPILEPASLRVRGWSQLDYHQLWTRVITQYIDRMIVMPGWQYSRGCVVEYGAAISQGIRVEDAEGALVDAADAVRRVRTALAKFERAGSGDSLKAALDALERLIEPSSAISASSDQTPRLRKDESLDKLAELINVAQFVSFSPGKHLRQEYARVRGRSPNHRFRNARAAIEELLAKSTDLSVNIRSFKPESPQSHEFVYGLKTVDAAVAAAERLGAQGLHVIANETIDVHDGGVSGVVLGDVIEFAPDDTPRCVEKPGVASFPRSFALSLLTSVYRFVPDIDVARTLRLEFSIHPLAVGWRHTHTLGWELEKTRVIDIAATFSWPNRFSRFLGDKAFGLLVADTVGLRVPKTTVFSRRIAPFTFGQSTGDNEIWLRTCPTEQVPGKFTTSHGWLDPFKLMKTEDPGGSMISSVLAQSSVPPAFSGAAIVGADGELIVEGKRGEGETLMLGLSQHEVLPENVRADICELYNSICPILGPVRFEWVHDGSNPWIVQLHRGATQTSRNVIVPGEADRWRHFDLGGGLAALREQLSQMAPGEGIIINGEVGLTSHIADVLRKANHPARVLVGSK